MDAYKEEEMIAQIRAGDSGAFCEWVEKHKTKAVSVAYSFCANYEDAKDISQEAFIKTFKAMKHFRGSSKLYTWFYRILVNVCKDYLRRKNRNRFINFNIRFNSREATTGQQDIFERIASSDPTPGEQLLNKELGEELTSAIASLPEKQRTAFILKNIHGLSIKEIAEITRSAVGTIKANLFKATANLQSKLKIYTQAEIPGGVI